MTTRLRAYLLMMLICCGCTPHQTDVLVLDFVSASTPKIAKRLEYLNVSYIMQLEPLTLEQIKTINPKAIILSGSSQFVSDPHSPKPASGIYDLGIPILGICYGMQLMAYQMGGQVQKCRKPEIDQVLPITITGQSELIPDNLNTLHAWMFHRDCVTEMPKGFEVLAHTKDTSIAMAQDSGRRLYATQFHPERFDKSPEATVILDTFVKNFVQVSQ
jgi:GMP synthase (glutamine-hydrolysing)